MFHLFSPLYLFFNTKYFVPALTAEAVKFSPVKLPVEIVAEIFAGLKVYPVLLGVIV